MTNIWPAPQRPPDIPPAESTLDINCERQSKDEIRAALAKVIKAKASGPDGIPAEAIKAGRETSVDMLYTLIAKIWEEEEIPRDRKEGYSMIAL